MTTIIRHIPFITPLVVTDKLNQIYQIIQPQTQTRHACRKFNFQNMVKIPVNLSDCVHTREDNESSLQ